MASSLSTSKAVSRVSSDEMKRFKEEMKRVAEEKDRIAEEEKRTAEEQELNDEDKQRIIGENERNAAENERIAAEDERIAKKQERIAEEKRSIVVEINRRLVEEKKHLAEMRHLAGVLKSVVEEQSEEGAEKGKAIFKNFEYGVSKGESTSAAGSRDFPPMPPLPPPLSTSPKRSEQAVPWNGADDSSVRSASTSSSPDSTSLTHVLTPAPSTDSKSAVATSPTSTPIINAAATTLAPIPAPKFTLDIAVAKIRGFLADEQIHSADVIDLFRCGATVFFAILLGGAAKKASVNSDPEVMFFALLVLAVCVPIMTGVAAVRGATVRELVGVAKRYGAAWTRIAGMVLVVASITKLMS